MTDDELIAKMYSAADDVAKDRDGDLNMFDLFQAAADRLAQLTAVTSDDEPTAWELQRIFGNASKNLGITNVRFDRAVDGFRAIYQAGRRSVTPDREQIAEAIYCVKYTTTADWSMQWAQARAVNHPAIRLIYSEADAVLALLNPTI